MAIQFKAAASSSGNVTTLTISKPTGTAEGDVMVAAIGTVNATSISTPPSGWTLSRSIDNGTDLGLDVYYKVAGASEPSSYDWVLSARLKHAGIICTYYGNAASPGDQENGQATSSSTDHDAPTITPTVGNTKLVASYVILDSTTWTADASMTERQEEDSGVLTVMMSDEDWVSGATGVRTAVAGAANVGCTHMLDLKAALETCVIWIQEEVS